MTSKKLVFYISIILLFLSHNKLYAGGLSAWIQKTPYGHEIYHDGTADGWITLSLDTTSVSFKHFYFYKEFTIAYVDSSYLIINEKTQSIQEFKDEKTWKTKLEEQKLVPFIKREYSADYSSAFENGIILLFIFLPFPFFLPLLWLTCLISLAFSTRKFYGFRKHFSWAYPTIFILILIIDSFPQSI